MANRSYLWILSTYINLFHINAIKWAENSIYFVWKIILTLCHQEYLNKEFKSYLPLSGRQPCKLSHCYHKFTSDDVRKNMSTPFSDVINKISRHTQFFIYFLLSNKKNLCKMKTVISPFPEVNLFWFQEHRDLYGPVVNRHQKWIHVLLEMFFKHAIK